MAMAMRQEEPDAEGEDFNPFLSPSPPPLYPTMAAPTLPPRNATVGNSNAPGTAAGSSSIPSSSTARRASTSRNTGSGGSSGGNSVTVAMGTPPNQVRVGRTPAGQTASATAAATTTVAPPPYSPPDPVPPTGARRPSSSHSPSTARRPPRISPAAPTPALTSLTTTTPMTLAAASASAHRCGSSSGGGGGASSAGSSASNNSSSSRAITVRPSSAPAAAGAAAASASSSAAAAGAASPPTAATTQAGASAASSANTSPDGTDRRRGGSWNWGNLGRSLIGAVLGPGAIGGEDQGGTGDRAAGRGGGGGGRQRFRVLTPHEMVQTPEGKFSVSVWRKNKQDAEPVQVAVGVYDSAYEGQRAAECFSPPLWQESLKNSRCAVCDSTFGYVLKRKHHCRNCGRLVCSACAEAFWPRNMLPPTYNVDTFEKKVRVCSTCYSAGEDFRKALLAGSEEEAMAAFSTGCVNLRVPYTIYHNELPVHCAAAGGNLNILAWLVDDRCCPLFLDKEKKVALGDSRRLSVMGAAAAAGHIQIMRYLAFTQGCKVTEIRDMNSLWNALEKCLYDGANVLPAEGAGGSLRSRHSEGSYGGGGYPSASGAGATDGAEVAAPLSDDDSCIVCFERKIDCTLVPCGHHCCCLTCAAQFEQCPVCRADVEQKIRAISV